MRTRRHVAPTPPPQVEDRREPDDLYPCTRDRLEREARARENGERVAPTPYDVLHDYVSGPVFNSAVIEAQALCGQCPIQSACLVENRDEVWVRAMVKGPQSWKRRNNSACGTDAGYFRHIRDRKNSPKTTPCEPCRRAHADAEAARLERKRGSAA